MSLSRVIQVISEFFHKLFGYGRGGGGGGGTPKIQLLRCPNREPQRVESAIGREGGTIELAGHRLELPPGAVTDEVKFTLSLAVDEYLRLDIQASGADWYKFALPVNLFLSWAKCEATPDDRAQIYKIDPKTGEVIQELGGRLNREEQGIITSLRTLSRYTIGWPG
jgi:hypothetical protein